MYEYQVEHLGQKVADKRAAQRTTAKSIRDNARLIDEVMCKEDGYCPQAVQALAPEKIEGDWDKIWKGVSFAPKVPPHKRNWDRIA